MIALAGKQSHKSSNTHARYNVNCLEERSKRTKKRHESTKKSSLSVWLSPTSKVSGILLFLLLNPTTVFIKSPTGEEGLHLFYMSFIAIFCGMAPEMGLSAFFFLRYFTPKGVWWTPLQDYFGCCTHLLPTLNSFMLKHPFPQCLSSNFELKFSLSPKTEYNCGKQLVEKQSCCFICELNMSLYWEGKHKEEVFSVNLFRRMGQYFAKKYSLIWIIQHLKLKGKVIELLPQYGSEMKL